MTPVTAIAPPSRCTARSYRTNVSDVPGTAW